MAFETPAHQELTVTSGDVTLSARLYPNPGKPALLFVHGYPDNSHCWDATIEALRDEFHIATYDVRGAGRSDIPKKVSAYRMDRLIEDQLAVLEQVLPDQKVHLVAHDWGSIQTWNAIMDPRIADRVVSYTSLSGLSFDHAGQWMRTRFAKGQITTALGQLLKSWYMFAFQIPGFGHVMWTPWMGRNWHKLLGRREKSRVPQNPNQLSDGRNGIKLYRANLFRHMLTPKPKPIDLPIQMLVLTEDPFVSPKLYCDHGTFLDQLWRHDLAVPHWLPFKDPALLAHHIREFVNHQEGAPETPALKRARKRAHPPQGKFGGRHLLITGAGGGIGRQTALAFAREGADVIVSDINEQAAQETAALVRELGVEATVFVANVADRDDWDRLAQFVDDEAGPVDLIINNAGIGMAGEQLEMTREAWDRVLGINLGGLIEGSRLFGSRLVARRSPGHIVNVVSASAFAPTRMFPAYAVSKAAALMQTESLRAELAEHKIGVTAACPGFVDTGIAQATEYVGASDADQKARRNNADTMYKRRAFTPEQVAKSILKAVLKNKPIALIGSEAYVIRFVQRFLPGLGRQFAKIKLPDPKS